jgi:autotransporter-associated beta strand protein
VAVDATSSGYATKIEVDTLVRTNRSVLLFDAVRNSAQVNEKFVVTNGAPAVVNGIVAPYLLATAGVDYWQTHFATYDSVNGFGKTSYVTMPSPGAGTEVVSYGGAVSGSPSIWALKTTGALSGSGTITINGGGLILGQSIAPNINFGAAEGVIFSDQINPNNCNITGKISGSGGLTLAGGGVRLSNVGNDFSGLITIAHGNRVGGPGAMAMAELDTAPATTRSLGNADNDLFLNGGVFCNWSATGNALLASRAVTLGPLGGYFLGYSGYPYTIYGPISGEGFLVLTGTMQGNYGPPDVTLDASGNTYSGGTRVCGWLTVNAGSSVGTGPVMLHYGSATFKGNANISTNARLQVCLDTKAYFQSATPAVGSLVGAGKVQLGATGVDTTLTVGQDNSDGAFLGEISQFAGRTGSVVKEGSGTWTLHGRHLYTGATTVNAGTLKLRGSLAGGLTIGSGGKLAVDLGPDGASYGAVAGAVTLGGTLTLNLADGYQPAVGQSWTLIGGASGFSGGFSSVTPAGYKAVASGGNLVLSRVPSGTVFFLR